MKFCTLNNDYLNFLRNKEPRIPYNDYGQEHYKPFFHTLFNIGDLSYVTQITSPKERHKKLHNMPDFKKIFIETNHIKNGKRTRLYVGSINLNYMFPIPKQLIYDLDFEKIDDVRNFKNDKAKQKYIYFLKQELKAIEELNLSQSALKLYNLKSNHPEIPVSQRCLDFKQLEIFAQSYINALINSESNV